MSHRSGQLSTYVYSPVNPGYEEWYVQVDHAEHSPDDRHQRAEEITLRDVLRAIFLPDRQTEQSAPAVLHPQRQPPRRPSGGLTALPERPQVTYHLPPIAGVESAAPLYRAVPIIGAAAVILTAYLAQRMLTADGAGLTAALLYLLAALIWLALLLFAFAPPDGALLQRGPQVTGSVGYPLPRVLDVDPLSARGIALLLALPLSIATYILTAGNVFTAAGVVAWVLSVILWMIVVAERTPRQMIADVGAWLKQVRREWLTALRKHGAAILALLTIIGLAAFFRFYRLDAVPNEMTSDHVEKLLDAYDVSRGIFHIFFTRNAGREAIQFYLVALASKAFGTGMSFLTLKLVTAFEGLLLIPLIVALGREMVDRETGYFAAALVAISWWHVMLSRLALRIVLTPLVFTLLLIALVRGIRTGSRQAWVWAGFWMGVGVYAYQALRITPLVALAACAISVAGPVLKALLAHWQARDDAPLRRQIAANAIGRQALNLALAGLVMVAIAVPMLRVWHDYPDDLWNRVINRTTSAEVQIKGDPLGVFADNYRRALLMFNVRGDVAWISSVPGEPVMDTLTAAFLVLGVVAWGVRLFVRRDPADVFLVAAGLIMLLPSALAIAFPIENPSTTRASGALPVVFVLAAWPLALITGRWCATLGRLRGAMLAALLTAIVLGAAALANFSTYFERYATSYRNAALNPGEVAAAVREVIGPSAPLDGVWLQGWPYWHDYRAIGIEAGDITFDNAILDVPMLVNLLNSAPQTFAVRPLVFIVHPQDQAALNVLRSHFPQGRAELHKSATEGRDFYLFIVPAE